MKKFLLIWFALSLVFNPVAGALASAADKAIDSSAGSHCPGHKARSEPPQDMDCCPSDNDSKQCCDHCVAPVSALLNAGFTLSLNRAADLAVTVDRQAPSKAHSPPYRPPQA